MSERVLITGANGFIGRYCVDALRACGFDVTAACYGDVSNARSDVRYLQLDIRNEDSIRKIMLEERPSRLLHLAWYVEPGKYMTSEKNLEWLVYSLNLIRSFADAGGKRLVTAGTCAEYDWENVPADGVFSESSPVSRSGVLYCAAKNSLNTLCSSFMKSRGLTHAHGRVFYLFGSGESEKRLVGSAVAAMKRNEAVTLRNGGLVRDYLYVKDVASAFASLIASDIVGEVNIGSGNGVALCELMRSLESTLGLSGLVKDDALPSSEPAAIIADNHKLLSSGWTRRFTLDAAFSDYLAVQGESKDETDR